MLTCFVAFYATHIIVVDGCTAPTAGTQTELPDAAIGYAVGDTFTYVCNSGYSYDGESADLTITCGAGGVWSDTTPPVCGGEIL